jgi:hypothetical protein
LTLGVGDKFAEIDLAGLVKAVEETFEQVSYGLQKEDLGQLLPNTSLDVDMDSVTLEIPVTLRLNRWEAKDLDLIPEKEGPAGKGRIGLKGVFEQRRAERREIKGVVVELVKGLEESEIMELLGIQNGNGGNAVASGSGSGKKDSEDVVEVVDGQEKEKKKNGKKVDMEVEVMDVDAETGELAEKKKKSTRKPKEEVSALSLAYTIQYQRLF